MSASDADLPQIDAAGAPRLTDDAIARRAAGRAVRQIGHALVGHDADEELLDDVATTLEGLTARLEKGSLRHRPIEQVGHRETGTTERGASIESYDDRPFSAHWNRIVLRSSRTGSSSNRRSTTICHRYGLTAKRLRVRC